MSLLEIPRRVLEASLPVLGAKRGRAVVFRVHFPIAAAALVTPLPRIFLLVFLSVALFRGNAAEPTSDQE